MSWEAARHGTGEISTQVTQRNNSYEMHQSIQYRQSVKRLPFHEINSFSYVLVLLTEDGWGHHHITHPGNPRVAALRSRPDCDVASGKHAHHCRAITNRKHGNTASAHLARSFTQ